MTAPSAIDMVRRVPMFSGLSDPDAGALVRALSPRTLATGDVLFRQGDPGDTLVVVASGALDVRVARVGGGDTQVASIAAGEVVGEMACIDPQPRSATVVATSPTVVYELHRSRLDALRTHAPAVASAIVAAVIRDVTKRLRDVNTVIEGELGGGTPKATSPSTPPPSGESKRGGMFQRLVDKLRGVS